MARIESLLSARLFLVPQVVGNRIFFMSNISGRISLYAMDEGGSVPEPLLPPHIALQNPHLMEGDSFVVFPRLGRILVMVDRDGDEIYQPAFVPVDGGFPESVFPGRFEGQPVHCILTDLDRNIAYLHVESRTEQVMWGYRADLVSGELTKLAESRYAAVPAATNESHTKTISLDGYSAGDHVIYLQEGDGERRLLYGTPIEDRKPGDEIPLNSISDCHFVDGDRSLLFTTSLWSDSYGLGMMELADPSSAREVAVEGAVHEGAGELVGLEHSTGDRYVVGYNIDGCSWRYEAAFDAAAGVMRLEHVLCGAGELADGVLESCRYDREGDRYALSFSTATSPTQIHTVAGPARDRVVRHTRERVLGIADGVLSPGEDASFTSFDGLRVSARLYLPAASLGFEGPRPLIYYVHGGPQSQERPDFAWFSMPLIQFLTVNGFAVFVPNARGSTGYGLEYTKRVDRDWGGQDRLDHVHAMTEVLPSDSRVDTKRAGVVGRSYGGYMTLTQAARHPELWAAAVDMFGPYDLIGFGQRIPETWKPYFDIALGNPETDRDFLVERSPRTYIENVACPLLVIQGKNDPRVLEVESAQIVEELKSMGKDVEYLMFEDEGHDVLKFENRVTCYDAITEFFRKHLRP
jgi:dipeptidyl aminopeptidase/acylaminoacyl peptidase